MAHNKTIFQYQELKPASQSDGEFRLLTLLPGPTGSQIQCTLQSFPLDNAPSYEALSYTWGNPKGPKSKYPAAGDPNSKYQIDINDSTAEISYNLFNALDQMQSRPQRKLWVDALCIDQDNDFEKSHQVQAMARIFKGADRVIAWLGEEDPSVSVAFDMLNEICYATKVLISQYCALEKNLAISRVTDGDIEAFLLSKHDCWEWDFVRVFSDGLNKALRSIDLDLRNEPVSYPGMSARRWPHLQHAIQSSTPFSQLDETEDWFDAFNDVFVARSYWTRLWVIQEVTVAKEVVFYAGKRHLASALTTIPFLIQALKPINEPTLTDLFKAFDPDFTRSLTNTVALLGPGHFYRNQILSRFSHQLGLTNGLVCTEPRDYIYALLDLTENSIGIRPDYEKSVSEIYVEATRAIIRQDDSLNNLCARYSLSESTRQGRLPSVNLPSWVPHYESLLQKNSLWTVQEMQHFSAGAAMGNQSMNAVSSSSNDAILETFGYLYATIAAVGPTINAFAFTTDILIAYLLSDDVRAYAGRFDDKQFWRALCMDVYVNFTKSYRMSDPSAELDGFDEHMANARSTLPPNNVIYNLRRNLHEMTVANTGGGQFAMVYGDVRPDDFVYIANGSPVPFIIRRVLDLEKLDALPEDRRGEAFYELVGPAYIHGIMDGEIPALAKEQRSRQTTASGERLEPEEELEIVETAISLV